MHYIPALDGIRALAVLLVLAFHARVPGFGGGFFGVDVFFVLSGYLITRLLREEHARSGGIAVGAFYLRRLRRLYPALLVMLAAYLAIAPFVFDPGIRHVRDAAVAALYLSDYGRAFWEVPSVLQHTWSLAVEEHFYLLWPLILMGLLRTPPRWHLPVLLGMFVLTSLWRQWVFVDAGWIETYCRFDTRLSGLVLGGVIAFLAIPSQRLMVPAGFALLLAAVMWADWRQAESLAHWMLVVEVGAACLVLGGQQSRILAVTPLVWLGKMSYGIYLWHYPVMYWMRGKQFGWEETLLVGAAVSITAAALSYYTVEAVFRRRRERGLQDSGVGAHQLG